MGALVRERGLDFECDDFHSEDGIGGGGLHVSLLGWKCLKNNKMH